MPSLSELIKPLSHKTQVPMHTGLAPSENRGYPSLTTATATASAAHHHQNTIRVPVSSSGPGPTYAHSQQSGRLSNLLKKEPVHLPYKSASPDFSDIPVAGHGNYRADTSYTPRYYRGSRMRSGYPMAAFYGAGSDMHIFTQIRSRLLASGRQQSHNQQLPQLSVVPAPKHSRMYHQRRSTEPNQQQLQKQPQQQQPKPVVVKRVEVTLHEVQQAGRLASGSPSPSQERENNPLTPKLNLKPKLVTSLPSPKESTSIPLKPVDLNKGLNAATAIKKRSLGSKGRVPPLDESLSAKVDVQVMSLNHLPLKEVYLKPDPTTSREQASRQQQDKTIRILNWLRDLNYLDEKTVQRGRTEVERTNFQLPEIREVGVLVKA